MSIDAGLDFLSAVHEGFEKATVHRHALHSRERHAFGI